MKKKIGILLTVIMIMTLLSGCAIGGNSYTDNNQPTNPEGNVNVAEVDLEGVYWLCEDGEVMGFYLDGNGKYAELSGDGYKEGTYDCLYGVIENTVATYNFRTFDENGVCKYVACEVRSDGKVYIEEKGYAPVDEIAFNEYVPEPSPEPEPEPEQNWSKPFMGKYFVGESAGLTRGIYMDEKYLYSRNTYYGESEPVEYSLIDFGDGTYQISDNGGGLYYYEKDGSVTIVNEYDGATLGNMYPSDKAVYDAILPN